MRRLLLLCLAAACGSSSPHPAAPAPSATASPAPAPAAEPKPSVVVWTEYTDFSGHGVKATGRFYRELDGRWQSAPCTFDHNSDPEAGDGPPVPSCGTWTDEPDAHRATLDSLRDRQPHNDIRCDQQPDLCSALGLSASKPTP